jgi:hypothetical protein
MKQSYSELIVDQSGVELLVSYDTEIDSYTEEFHGTHLMSDVSIELKYVELIIRGKSVEFTHNGKATANLIPFLTKEQLDCITDNLSQY